MLQDVISLNEVPLPGETWLRVTPPSHSIRLFARIIKLPTSPLIFHWESIRSARKAREKLFYIPEKFSFGPGNRARSRDPVDGAFAKEYGVSKLERFSGQSLNRAESVGLGRIASFTNERKPRSQPDEIKHVRLLLCQQWPPFVLDDAWTSAKNHRDWCLQRRTIILVSMAIFLSYFKYCMI